MKTDLDRNTIATQALHLALDTCLKLAVAEDPQEFSRLDRIAQRACYLATACSRMVAPAAAGSGSAEQEGAESPG
jgi:hypothetical protein